VIKALEVTKVSNLIAISHAKGGKVLICGNGGLAAESEHFAAELMVKFSVDQFLPCISLTSNSSLITALANDMGYENVFAHQVTVLGKPGDILIAMTTSKSVNIVKALAAGHAKGMTTVCICSTRQTLCADVTIQCSGDDTESVQNEIIKLLHWMARETKNMVSLHC
jgi:D-sedoheptulose 7-phosphate isomerase